MSADTGFPIPQTLLDLFNQVGRRETSIYSREEQPNSVDVIYETSQYLGIPIKRVQRIVLNYNPPIPAEVYNVAYTEDGNVERIEKITPVLP